MTKTLQRIASVAVALLFAVALCPGAALAESAPGGMSSTGAGAASTVVAEESSAESELQAAASRKNLKSAGFTFDLTSNKARSVKTYLRGTAGLDYTVKIGNVKKTTLSSGKKQVTFTATYALKKLTKAQRNAIFTALHSGSSFNKICGGFYWGLVDYTSGLNLMTSSNSCGVQSSVTPKYTYTKKYKNSRGDWFKLVKCCKITCKVTFPASYKRTSFFIGSMTFPYSSCNKLTKRWWKTKNVPIYKTMYYKKCLSNTHCMRVY